MLAAICLFAWKAVARANTGNAQVLSPDLIFGGFGDLWCTKACRATYVGCQQNGPSRSQARSLQRRCWGGGLVDVLGTANDGDQEGCLEFSFKFLLFFLQHSLSSKRLSEVPCSLAMSFSIGGGGAGRHKKCEQGLNVKRRNCFFR